MPPFVSPPCQASKLRPQHCIWHGPRPSRLEGIQGQRLLQQQEWLPHDPLRDALLIALLTSCLYSAGDSLISLTASRSSARRTQALSILVFCPFPPGEQPCCEAAHVALQAQAACKECVACPLSSLPSLLQVKLQR